MMIVMLVMMMMMMMTIKLLDGDGEQAFHAGHGSAHVGAGQAIRQGATLEWILPP